MKWLVGSVTQRTKLADVWTLGYWKTRLNRRQTRTQIYAKCKSFLPHQFVRLISKSSQKKTFFALKAAVETPKTCIISSIIFMLLTPVYVPTGNRQRREWAWSYTHLYMTNCNIIFEQVPLFIKTFYWSTTDHVLENCKRLGMTFELRLHK